VKQLDVGAAAGLSAVSSMLGWDEDWPVRSGSASSRQTFLPSEES
jgi:hypothetical protein